MKNLYRLLIICLLFTGCITVNHYHTKEVVYKKCDTAKYCERFIPNINNDLSMWPLYEKLSSPIGGCPCPEGRVGCTVYHCAKETDFEKLEHEKFKKLADSLNKQYDTIYNSTPNMWLYPR